MGTAVLTDEQTLEEVISCLTEHIPLDTQGACDQQMVFTILARAASTCDSIENTCKTLEDAPGGNDIRYHLDKYQDMGQMEQQINQALQDRLPPRIVGRRHRMAIDLNLLPYYGTPSPEEEPYIYRSQAKDGTCSFYAYASCYLIRRGKRVTLALRAVHRDDTMVAIITRLLDHLRTLHLRLKRLYLDRGFFSVPVIRWLKAADIPFEMPVIIRGKQGGTRQLLQGGRSYKTRYAMKSQVYGTVTFEVWVVCVYRNGKYGKHGREYFAYAVYRVNLGVRALHHDYRLRFGIESSYRLKNTCRIKTTSKNPVIRFLFVGIAFVLIDLWIYLLWTYVSLPRKGGRVVLRALFPLKLMLMFLRQAIDRQYQVKDTICL